MIIYISMEHLIFCLPVRVVSCVDVNICVKFCAPWESSKTSVPTVNSFQQASNFPSKIWHFISEFHIDLVRSCPFFTWILKLITR
ncbi:hypothetical protein JHK84_046228 [Glycine max]|uniref:Secreted protein n=2 Tax=Glycine subgen. Soja TaxID=1462606 RepID=A0A0R0FFS4_SOYBN|nr:hypothetical protein JHK87_045995 [Glycine soja]KAG5101259.1 hypothetical protein JHK84_046228 [Glycine max]KAH1116274.1 hypothetical protein GYH30_045950 [Glycine max]RZB54735.1 hypothetical protein D0Y65_044603 [Glycine soja]